MWQVFSFLTAARLQAMAKTPPAAQPKRLSVGLTFSEEERADFELLSKRAEDAGVKVSTFARELLIQALHFDQNQHHLAALNDIQQRLDALQRNVARGTYMVLRAAEMRDEGEKPADARGWVNEVMVVKEL